MFDIGYKSALQGILIRCTHMHTRQDKVYDSLGTSETKNCIVRVGTHRIFVGSLFPFSPTKVHLIRYIYTNDFHATIPYHIWWTSRVSWPQMIFTRQYLAEDLK